MGKGLITAFRMARYGKRVSLWRRRSPRKDSGSYLPPKTTAKIRLPLG